MERVELLTELEQRFGVKVPEAAVHEIFTVRQLVEAVRPQARERRRRGRGRGLERDPRAICRPTTDPVLGRLLAPRRLMAPLLWVIGRVVRMLVARVRGAAGSSTCRRRARSSSARITRAISIRSCCAACCRIASSRRCSSSAPPSISRRRSRRGSRGQINLRAGRSRRESGAGDEGRRVRPGARQGAGAVSGRRALDRRHGEELQEGRADPGPAPARADRAGGDQAASSRSGRGPGASTGA